MSHSLFQNCRKYKYTSYIHTYIGTDTIVQAPLTSDHLRAPLTFARVSTGRCALISEYKMLVNKAETSCALRGERLLTPGSEAEARALQSAVAAQYPARLPAFVGLVRCRYALQDVWRQPEEERETPRTS